MSEKYSVEAILSLRDQGFTSGMEQASGVMGKMRGGVGGIVGGITKMAGAFGLGTLAVDGLKSAFRTVTGSIDGAISRVDTLANADRVFANMGFAAEDTAVMMENLNESITGLPTTLDGAISNVQKLASSTQDVKGSEEIFSALNNAVLGFGGTADGVDSVVNMFSRSLGRGTMQADEWNTMFDQMGPVLNAVAEEMGYTATELREGLSAGEIELDSFTEALLKLNEEGGGGLASLEQIAQDSTKGIRTSFTNAKTAITRGVATIIQSLNEGLENAGLMDISEMLTAWGASFNKVLIAISNNLDPFINLIKNVVTAIGSFVEGFMSAERIGTRFQNLMITIRSAFKNVVEGLFSGGGDISETFENIGAKVGDAALKLMSFVSDIAVYVRSLDVAEMKNKVFEKVQQIIDKIDWQRLLELARTLRDGVGDAIMFVVEKVQELWAGFKESGAVDAVIQAFKDFGSMIGTTIESISNLTGNMREGSISFEDIGNAIGKAVVFVANIVSWFYKASAAVGTFLSKVNPNVILAVVGAFAGFKFLEKFNPFKMFQRNAEKGIGGVGKSARKGGGIINKVFNGVGKVIVSVGKAIATVLKGIATVISSVAKGISTVLKGLASSLSILLQGIAKSISVVAKGLAQGLSIALKGLASAIRMIPIPHMLAFAVALGVVIAALALLATQGDGVKKILEGVSDVVGTVITSIGTVLVGVIETFGNVISQHGETIRSIIETIGESFSNFALSVGLAVAMVITSLEPLFEIIKDGMVEIAEIIGDTIVDVVEIIAEHLPVITEFIDGLVEKIPTIIDAFGRLAIAIGSAIAIVIDAVGDNAQGIIRAFGDAFEQAGGVVIGIINALNDALPNLESFVTAVIEAVGDRIPPIVEAFGESFKDMGEAVEGIIKAMGEQAPNFAGAIATIIAEIGVQARTTLRVFGETFETMGETVEGVIKAFGELHTTFSTNIGNLLDVIGDNATKVLDSFAEAFGDMADDVKGVIDKMSEHAETLGEVINGIIETLGEEITGVIDSFIESFESIGTTIEGVIDKIGDTAGDIANAIEKIAEAFVKLEGVKLTKINAELSMVASELLLIGKKNRARSADTINDVAEAINEFPDATSFASNLAAIALAMEALSETAAASTHVKSLGEAASNHHEDVSSFASALKSFPDLAPISSYLQSIGLALGVIGENGTSANTSLGDISDKMTPLETGIKNVSTALTNLDISLNATRLQSGNTGNVLDNLKQTIIDLGKTVSETLTRMMNQSTSSLKLIEQAFVGSFDTIKARVTNTMNLISILMSTSIQVMTSSVNSGLKQITRAFSSYMDLSLRSVQSAMSSIINSMRSVYGPAYSAGYNAGAGFNRGLANTRSQIMRTANNIANSVATTMRRALQTRSPSRVLAGIGTDAGMGLYVGLDGMMPRIEAMSERMADLLDFDANSTDFTISHSDDYNDVGREIVVHNKFELNGTEYRAFVEDIALEMTRQRNKEF